MNSDLCSDCQAAPYGPASLNIHLVGWMKARFRDLIIAGDVLHEMQWAAPWRDPQSSCFSKRAPAPQMGAVKSPVDALRAEIVAEQQGVRPK